MQESEHSWLVASRVAADPLHTAIDLTGVLDCEVYYMRIVFRLVD